jgi:hypothetical protein
MKIIPISKLRVGQKFQWIPNRWFGEGKLISKLRRKKFNYYSEEGFKWIYVYDLRYDAGVVNPPAVDYGVPSDTKVQLLNKKRKRK